MDARVINNIKGLAVDMNSVTEIDNIDMSLATANILYVLYLNHLVVNNNDDKWINRDRLVVSNETGSALLYATLYMAGYNLTIDDLKNFAKQGFKTPAYPELNITPGVDASVGLPGQGIATAVGMALAGKMQNKLTTFNNQSLIDYNVYALCTDHDLMEGVALEALSMAGNLKLDNFILLYQANEMIASDDVSLKLKAMGFDTIKIKDVNDLKGISRAIHKAKLSSRPTVIEYRVLFQDKVKLNKENIDQLKLRFHQPGEPFISDNEARDYFRREIMTRCSSKYNRWSDNYRKLIDNKLPINTNISWLLGQNINLDLSKINIEIDDDFKEPLRLSNSKVMQVIAKYIPNFVGGSRDLNSSTLTYLHDFKDIRKGEYDGRNINFESREQALGGILNGLALCGFKPFGSTLLAFADYLKPLIRQTCLMNLPVTYIFTHDSINIGEDGPIYQPVEQLSLLRNIPNMIVFRPCDMHELIGCWNIIINNKMPASLVLSKHDVPLLNTTSYSQVVNGAYVIKPETNKLDGIIVATGSEVIVACSIVNDLYSRFNMDFRVVSMPSRELFIRTKSEYQNNVLPKGVKTFVLEAASSYEMLEFATDREYLLNITKFGISSTKSDVDKYVDFDYLSLEERIYRLMKN